MLNDKDIKYIFLILLNKNIGLNEISKYRNYSLEILKKNIYNSREFKDFRNINLTQIRKIIEEILLVECNELNYEKYWPILINLKYNITDFKQFINTKIFNIKQDYKSFYMKYFKIDESIEVCELVEILKNNYSVDFYISTSDKFLQKSQEEIDRLLNIMES
jgi:hypothetical protein